jgi:hypothetical protein
MHSPILAPLCPSSCGLALRDASSGDDEEALELPGSSSDPTKISSMSRRPSITRTISATPSAVNQFQISDRSARASGDQMSGGL